MIYKAIKQNHANSGGHSGLSIPDLMRMMQKDIKAVKSELRALHADKKIIVRQGVNHKLIFLT